MRHVWRGLEMAQADAAVMASGHALLDAQLPGGGWPVGSLIEVQQAQVGQHVWQLVLPVLAQAVRQQAGPVVLVAPPYEPFGPSLAAQGLPGERLLCVRTPKPMARLWAAEQALRCADVAAVLAWLPKAQSAELRRLHMAAQQHGRLLFVFRGVQAQHEASPAQLRLRVEGAQALQIHILKRRGPPLTEPLRLPAHPPRLAALLQSRRRSGTAGPAMPAMPAALPFPATRPPLPLAPPERLHALDRLAALAGG